MQLNSDTDAWVCITPLAPDQMDRDWFVKRAAVMLAAPVACIIRDGTPWHFDTLRHGVEYHGDFDNALAILREYQSRTKSVGGDVEVDEMMQEAVAFANTCVRTNCDDIQKLTNAIEGLDTFSAAQIYDVLIGEGAGGGT